MSFSDEDLKYWKEQFKECPYYLARGYDEVPVPISALLVRLEAAELCAEYCDKRLDIYKAWRKAAGK